MLKMRTPQKPILTNRISSVGCDLINIKITLRHGDSISIIKKAQLENKYLRRSLIAHQKFIFKMAASASHWSDDEIVVLLKDGIIPPHWDPFNNKISYSLLDKLFQCCFVVEGRNDDLIKNALVNLDGNIILPSNINNLKKKVSRFVD